MKKIINPAIILMATTFISAYLLSHIDKITNPRILKLEKDKQEKALSLVLPGYRIGDKKSVKIQGGEVIYWEGELGENENLTKGYAFLTAKPGYSGDVKSMVGINDQGKILGLSILKQSETPGLGARCIEVASSKTFFGSLSNGTLFSKDPGEGQLSPWFQEQFKDLIGTEKINLMKKGDWNKSLKEDLLEKNGVTTITGATITTRAVVKSIHEGIEILKKVVELKPVVKNNDTILEGNK